MNAIDSILPLSSPVYATSSVTQSLDPRGFEAALAGARNADQRVLEAQEAAQDLVSIALVQPALKSLRDSSMAAPPFAPGHAERTFGAFLDAEIARNVAGAGANSLVDAIARRMTELSERLGSHQHDLRRPEVDTHG